MSYTSFYKRDENRKMKTKRSILINSRMWCLVFSMITGAVTGAIIVFYKFLAKHIIEFSEMAYSFLSKKLWLIPAVLVFLFIVSVIYSKAFKKHKNLQGGGIPTSVGLLRGLFKFSWLANLIGTFFLSLISFLIGVPLGNEGPSVQMGTAVGAGAVRTFSKKHLAWSRYSMTGGACAGFSAATGANLSGIVFAIEEAHGRISPMIILISIAAVMFSNIVTHILSPIFNVETRLLPKLNMADLSISQIWLPILIGVILGLFAVGFIKYYKLLNSFFNKTLSKIPQLYKIFTVLVITFALGLISYNFLSTGHHLTLEMFKSGFGVLVLVPLIFGRMTLTLSANISGITGGIFLPLISLGALVSALIFEVFNFPSGYYTYVIALGVVGCISAMMKMPFTAIIFAVEVLGFEGNILFAAAVSLTAFAVTEIFRVESINDYVIENRLRARNEGKEKVTREIEVWVEEGSFAVHKEIGDIFWPNGLYVLSIKHKENAPHTNEILGGDALAVRYTTYDEERLLSELDEIIKA